jgi:small-conductance mechanosensitive channel
MMEDLLRMFLSLGDVLIPILILAFFLTAGYIFVALLCAIVGRAWGKDAEKVVGERVRTPALLIFLLIGLDLALQRLELLSEQVAGHLGLLLRVLAIIVGAFVVGRAISGIVTHYGERKPSMRGMVPLLSRILNIFVHVLAFIIILYALGVNITAFVAGLGIAGIAVAFAMQETLSQFFAGMYVLSEQPIRVGDFVELETGQMGYVAEIGWRAVKIRELSNNIIVIPNSKLVTSVIRNYSLPKPDTMCLVNISVGYGSDLEKVERVTLEVAKKTMRKLGIDLPGCEPIVRFSGFGEYGINLTVLMSVKEFTQQFALRHEFVKDLHRRYREEGIEIPYPVRTVHLRKP